MASVTLPSEWQKFLAKHAEKDLRMPETPKPVLPPQSIPKAPKITRAAAGKLFVNYIDKNPAIRQNIIWCSSARGWQVRSLLDNRKYWRSYSLWSAALKNELKETFTDHVLDPRKRLVSLDPSKTTFTFDEIRKVYLAYVAHTLYLDIFSIVPWKLDSFDDHQLRWLLDGKYFAFNCAVDIDRKTLPDATGKYCFGYVEKMRTEVDPWNFYSVATPALPGDPALLFTKLSDELGVRRSATISDAVSAIARWCQDNLSHGSTTYYWGGGVFTGSSWIDQLYPSSDVMFLGSMEQTFINGFRQKLNSAYITPRLPAGVMVPQLVDTKGVFADPAMGQLDAQGNPQFPQRIGFMKHCTYNGCQTTGGLLHWLFRSINIPARQYSCFMGDVVAGNYPGAFHKGIEVSIGQPETIAVPHSDHFYQGFGIYHPSLPGGSYVAHLRDPHIDLINMFLPKNFLEWWLPPYNSASASADATAYGKKQYELYLSQLLMTGATGAFSSYVIEWWKVYEQAGRVISSMDTSAIPWMVLLNNLSMPTGVRASVLSLAQTNIRARINDIENGINTKWGRTLAAYEAGFLQWEQNLYTNKIGAAIWTSP